MRRHFARTAVFIGLAISAAGGCHQPSMPPLAGPGNSSCGDPCGPMVCPSGSVCSWNSNCQPRCEPQPLPSSLGH